jgi:hypothetical protein
VHPALRRRPIPGSGPRRHDTRHHLIAPRACRETSLPASQHYCPGASQGACDALDHAKIAPSTADAATNFLPRSPIRHRLPRPAQPLRKTPPRQIPIVGRPPTRPPAGSFLGGFRTPASSLRVHRSRGPASETHRTRRFAPAASDIGFAPDTGRRMPTGEGVKSTLSRPSCLRPANNRRYRKPTFGDDGGHRHQVAPDLAQWLSATAPRRRSWIGTRGLYAQNAGAGGSRWL